MVTLLRRHKTAQKEDKLRAGNQWVDSGLVFTNEFGGPVEPRNLLRVIETAAKTAGVEGLGVHTLRHSAAVAWLEAGVHIKAVADLLGHSSIAVTGARTRTDARTRQDRVTHFAGMRKRIAAPAWFGGHNVRV
jgi:site-specific recombinase XerD